jgi:hypothetical protein
MTKINRAAYLERAEGGEKVGKTPGKIKLETLRALGHPESPIKGIRAKCLDCSGDVPSEVRKCVTIHCALWPFRMGVNPFHGKQTAEVA